LWKPKSASSKETRIGWKKKEAQGGGRNIAVVKRVWEAWGQKSVVLKGKIGSQEPCSLKHDISFLGTAELWA